MQFGIRSTQGLRGVHAVARLHLGHAASDSLDSAGGIGAGRIRQWRLDGVVAGTHVCVVGIDADRANAQKNLTGLGLRRGILRASGLPGRRIGVRESPSSDFSREHELKS